MKILKYLVGALALFLFLFIVVGLFRPKVEYGHTISVEKSAKEAWAVHQDQSKYSEWLEGFKSMELLSGEEGQVGSTYRIVVSPGEGQEDFEMIETLVSIEAGDHVTVSMDSEAMVFDQTTQFVEVDGQTQITTESVVQGKGMMMRSMFALMGMAGSFQKQEEKNLEALKLVINENVTEYYPKTVDSIDSTRVDSI